jgi:dTDP-D-glucose 4,6-dehydratase
MDGLSAQAELACTKPDADARPTKRLELQYCNRRRRVPEKIRALANSNSKITFHPRPPDDPERRCPDISKAKKLLGWSPPVTLDEGLRKTIEWFRQRREASR